MDSADAWTIWLLQLGAEDILWYRMGGILSSSRGHSRVYLLGFTHSTWYSAARVLRQMGVDQTVPLLGGIHFDAPNFCRGH